MKAQTKITLTDDAGEKFFGEGPCRLLRAVERTGSLLSAAKSMNMAYSKAVKLIGNAEKVIGVPLIARTVGGVSGGGSTLTSAGKQWLETYERYRDACVEANRALYSSFFCCGGIAASGCGPSKTRRFDRSGCVILASGKSERFGSNKLLAGFRGKPLICSVLDATEGLFADRIVVTRSEDIAKLCEKSGVSVVLHSFPGKNDSIRLGVSALREKGIRNCMLCQADQPLLQRQTAETLAACAEASPELIWRLSWQGRAAAPVVFPEWAFDALCSLQKGESGRRIIDAHPERVRLLEAISEAELLDVDTEEDLRLLSTICFISGTVL